MKYFAFVFGLICPLMGFAQNSKAEKLETVRLALNWKAEPEFGGFYAADLKGLYKEQGLNVKLQEGGSGTPTVQMLANGKTDFAIVSSDEIILSHDRKSKNKVLGLFAVYQKSPYILMAHPERNFKTLKDLWTSEGLLAVQSGLPYFQFLTNKFGKTNAQVVPYVGGVASFLNNKTYSQQGFISIEPVTAEKGGVKPQTFLIADEGYNPYLVVLATTQKMLREKPELVKKVVKATRAGWEHYLQNPEETNKHMAAINKSIDLETFNKGAELQKDLIRQPGILIGTMTEDRWAVMIQQMKELKLIKEAPKAGDLYKNH